MFEPTPGSWPFRPVLQLTALAMLFALGGTIAGPPALRAVLAICATALAVAAGFRYLKIRRGQSPKR